MLVCWGSDTTESRQNIQEMAKHTTWCWQTPLCTNHRGQLSAVEVVGHCLTNALKVTLMENIYEVVCGSCQQLWSWFLKRNPFLWVNRRPQAKWHVNYHSHSVHNNNSTELLINCEIKHKYCIKFVWKEPFGWILSRLFLGDNCITVEFSWNV